MQHDLSSMSDAELLSHLKMCETKVSRFNAIQHATKILMNSLYGALGTPYFRMYNVHMAEGITLSGQVTVAQSYTMFNDYLNGVLSTNTDYVTASDTDSAYVDLTSLVNKILPASTPLDKKIDSVVKLCDEHFASMLTKTFDQFALDTNAWCNAIDMKREAIASACFVAKKNYVMNVYDNEGTRYATPKQKITGLEAIKSSTPEFFREKLKLGYAQVFGGTEQAVHKFVEDVYGEYMSMPIMKIAGTTSVTELDKYNDGQGGCVSGTPGHVRGAYAYNRLVKKLGKDSPYQMIRPGDKVKIVPLKQPNPLGENYFCFIDKYPKDLLDDKFIEREGNYQKYFVTPLMRVLGVVGWTHEYKPSLNDLFG